MIFDNLFAGLSAENSNQPKNMQRRHTRREGDSCVVIVNGNIYPVQNWSMGGTLIRADERLFGVNDEIPVTLKFKMGDIVRDVSQLARVVRKTRGRIAFQFPALNKNSRHAFQQVIDSYMTSAFADSHMA